MSPVMLTEKCPRISETTLSGTPFSIIKVTAECRSVCRPILAAGLRRATFKARSAFLGSHGSPVAVVKMSRYPAAPADTADGAQPSPPW